MRIAVMFYACHSGGRGSGHNLLRDPPLVIETYQMQGDIVMGPVIFSHAPAPPTGFSGVTVLQHSHCLCGDVIALQRVDLPLFFW